MMLMISIMLISAGVILFGSAFASMPKAGSSAASHKYYKSIDVNAGDSMWSIAELYLSEEYASKQDYIKEIMEVNHMDSTTLYADQKLIIPYYEREFMASAE